MITDTQLTEWLQDSKSVPIMLVQADYNGGTKYFATRAITVGGIYYEPLLKPTFSITDSITLDFDSSISFSDIELNNANGELDSWLNLVWVNREIRIYVGDAAWTDLATDFRNVFTGFIGNIDARNRTSINLTVRSALQELNTAVTASVLGNYFKGAIVPASTYDNPNKAALKPLVFGEVHNITPLLTDASMLEYMVHDGAVERIIEVRDNGVPVSFTTTGSGLPAGSFRLTRQPTGVITADVQGLPESRNLSTGAVVNTYTNSAANLIATIITKYGKTLSATKLDLASFNAVSTREVGVYLTDKTNVFALCDEIAKSCGMILTAGIASGGKISLIEPRPATTATNTVTDSDMFLNSLSVANRSQVKAAMRLGYARNWTVQNNLLTGIPSEHKELYATEYTEIISIDNTIASTYKLETETTVEPSYLITTATAQSIADTKKSIYMVPKTTYKMKLTSKYLGGLNALAVNSRVLVTSTRFGLSGTPGLVVSVKPDYFGKTLEVEVLV